MFCFSIFYYFHVVYVEGNFHDHVDDMRYIWFLKRLEIGRIMRARD